MRQFYTKIERKFKYGPAFFLLNFLLPTRKIPLKELKAIKPKKILLVKIHHKLGDMLLATPVFAPLRRRFPDTQIDFLAGTYNAQAVTHNRSLSSVFVFDRKKPFSSIGTLLRLRRERYDLCIVASASSFSTTNSILARLTGPKVITGYRAPYKGVPENRRITSAIYSYAIELPDPSVSESMYNIGYIAPFDCPVDTVDEVLHFTDSELAFARDWYASIRPATKHHCIGIHAGGTYASRQWPQEYFADLISRLLVRKGVIIIMFYGKGERTIVDSVLQAVNMNCGSGTSAIIHAPQGTFRQLAALQSHLDLFIGNDTGPLHAAASSGCTAIGIYTVTKPARWAPHNRTVTTLEQPTVDQVMATAERLLNQTAGAS